MIIACPWPPAAHAAIRANCPFSLIKRLAAVVANLTPVAPNLLIKIIKINY